MEGGGGGSEGISKGPSQLRLESVNRLFDDKHNQGLASDRSCDWWDG